MAPPGPPPVDAATAQRLARRLEGFSRALIGARNGTHAATENRSFFALSDGAWDIPALRTSLGDLFTKRAPFHGLEVEGQYPRVGQRTMSFSARSV